MDPANERMRELREVRRVGDVSGLSRRTTKAHLGIVDAPLFLPSSGSGATILVDVGRSLTTERTHDVVLAPTDPWVGLSYM